MAKHVRTEDFPS